MGCTAVSGGGREHRKVKYSNVFCVRFAIWMHRKDSNVGCCQLTWLTLCEFSVHISFQQKLLDVVNHMIS